MIKTRRFITGEGWTDEKVQAHDVESVSIQIGNKTAYVAQSELGHMRVHIREDGEVLQTFGVDVSIDEDEEDF